MATETASSSSLVIRSRYDVFLSFRGEDTRNNFTSHLHHALYEKGIHTFMDDKELQRGEAISPTILHAIEESKISIIVLSRSYASSTSCLDELVKILESKASKGQMVLPIFYDVDPSEVRNSEKGRFADAMARNEEKFADNVERVQNWRVALREVSNLSGWDLRNSYDESKFIQNIVQDVLCKLNRTILNVARQPVGLDSLIQDMLFLLSTELDDVRMVGICGIGGIGKTTLAKAIYNTIIDQFEGSSFIANVREISKRKSGLVQLQERLLTDILGQKKFEISNIHLGVNILRDRLCNKKILLVLDDVDQLDQLENLAGDCTWFGLGSRIMITTRDEHFLVAHGVKNVYKVKELNSNNSLQIFSLNAFKKPFPLKEYEDLSFQVINYAKGLPLALIVLGSHLCGRSIPEWKSTLRRLKRSPNKQIYDTLKISFDELEDNEKEIFLDIACFFKGEEKEYVANILDSCNFYADSGISILIDKSLIIIESNELWMHDLLQEMAQEIVRQESPKEPGKRSRLWFHEDVVRVLTEHEGTETIEGIKLDLPDEIEAVQLDPNAFRKMKNLRQLIVRNGNISGSHLNFLSNELRLLDWPGYPFSSLPDGFGPNNLVAMNLSHSLIKHIMMRFKMYRNLKSINLSFCEILEEIPDFSNIPNLENLILDQCTRLKEVHTSVGCLEKLVTLSLIQCYNLKSLPDLKLKSLQHLSLVGCSKLQKFPNIVEKMEYLEELHLDETALKDLPLSIENLVALKLLYLDSCENLEVLPSNLYKLQHLVHLGLSYCSKLQKIPEFPPNLAFLSAASCKSLESIPEYNGSKPTMLSYLDLINCEKLAKYQVENIANMLTNEGLVNAEITIPGSKIPDWFSHHDTKGRISFEVPSSLYAKPFIWSFYAVFGVEEGVESSTSNFSCCIEIVINNGLRLAKQKIFQSMESDHTWLTSFFLGSLRWSLNKMLWTRFDVSFTIEGVPREAKTRAILKKCGFHMAYKRGGHITVPTIVRKTI